LMPSYVAWKLGQNGGRQFVGVDTDEKCPCATAAAR
jgi:hypothetical protein